MPWTEQQYREFVQRRLKSESRTRERLINEASAAVGGLPNPKPKRASAPALARSDQRSRNRPGSVGIRVSIISFRNKVIDSDNLVGGAKYLRDAIAKHFGLSDAEGSGIEWDYSQCLTRGKQGVIVKIEQNQE